MDEGYFFQAEDGIRDVERSRGLGDVYKRQEVFHLENDFNKKIIRFMLNLSILTIA